MRITLVHQAALGDTILLLPLLAGLRGRYPRARITLVSHASLGRLLQRMGAVDDHGSAEGPEHGRWFADDGASASGRPEWAACDLLISAVSDGKDAWAQHAEHAAPDARRVYFEPRPPADYAGHVTRYHREQLAAQGLELPEPAAGIANVNENGAVLIHPGSGGAAKCWPRERFGSVAEKLEARGIVVKWLLGPVETERWGAASVDALRCRFSVLIHQDIETVYAELVKARLYLGNDSGVTHLAAASGIRTVALFGPSNLMQWRPVGPQVQVVKAPGGELSALRVDGVFDHVFACFRPTSADCALE